VVIWRAKLYLTLCIIYNTIGHYNGYIIYIYIDTHTHNNYVLLNDVNIIIVTIFCTKNKYNDFTKTINILNIIGLHIGTNINISYLKLDRLTTLLYQMPNSF
jgi:hypothetical protein